MPRCEFFITLHNFLCTPFTFDSAQQAQHLRIRSLLPFGGPLQTFNETALSVYSDDHDIDPGDDNSDDNDGDNRGNYSDTHGGHKRRRLGDGDGGNPPPLMRSQRLGGGSGGVVHGFSSLTEELKEELTSLNVQAIRPTWNFEV